jgi:GH24 family phage-related lysozyme (muramidase)
MTGPKLKPCRRKPIFDAVRAILRRGFRGREVERLDRAIDETFAAGSRTDPAEPAPARPPRSSAGGPSVPHIRRQSAERPQAQSVGPEGIALIKRFEGCARLRRDGLVEAYPDPATGGEPWTIGWGATGPGLEPGTRIGPGTVWTQDQCDARLETDVERYAAEVAQAIGDAPTTQAQFDAMVSFHYNTGAIARATLTRRHCAGDHAGAAREFARWNKAAGRVMRGLVRRRAAEAALYRS